MRGFAAVARREVEERRTFLLAALAASLLPFVATLLPWLPMRGDPSFRALFALIVSATFGVAGSLLVGGSVLGRDLAEGRLGFHFSRPLPAWAIWGGKLAGGVALVLAAELLALLPAWLAAGGFPARLGTVVHDPLLLASLLLHPIPLLLLANAVSVALRSRSPWLAVDFVAAVALAALVTVPVRRLLRFGLVPEPRLLAVGLGLLATALLLAASYAQVAAGRVDPRRAHGAQSLVLWGTLFPLLLGVEVASRRAVDPGPGNLHVGLASPASADGRWVAVQGSHRGGWHGYSTYLLDAATGRSILVAAWTGDLTVSADGRRALFTTFSGKPFASSPQLTAIDLSSRDPLATEESTPGPSSWSPYALSPAGDRVAVVSGSLVQALELPGFRLLAAVRLPEAKGWIYRPSFAGNDAVRLHPWRGVKATRTEGGEIPPILELDLPGKRLAETGRYAVPPPADGLAATAGPGLSRLLLRSLPGAREGWLVDGRSGALVATFPSRFVSGHFLADGRLLVSNQVGAERVLTLFSPDGERLRTIRLGIRPSDRNVFGHEIAPGLVPVATSGWSERPAPGDELLLVDVGTGTVRKTGLPIWPAGPATRWWGPSDRVPPPGSPATRLFVDRDRRLVSLDPATLRTSDPLAPRGPGA